MRSDQNGSGLGPRRERGRRATWLTVALSTLLSGCASWLGGNAPPAPRHRYSAAHMGAPCEIVCAGVSAARAERAAKAAFARIGALDATLSDWDPSSELSRLTQRAHPDPAPVSADLFDVLQRAEQLSRETGGAFDCTVGPLVRLWRRANRQRALPSEERLTAAKERTGWQQVELSRPSDDERSFVRLNSAGMRLDLGGIAKGHAAQQALQVLREHGVPCAVVDLGGDLAIGEPPPGEDGWKIGLQPLDSGPATSGDEPEPSLTPGTIRLAGRAIATSGDAFRFVEIDGVRYSHILDPRTGLGLTTRIGVTVIADDGATADALASALCVLGPEEGLQFAERRDDCEARIVWRDDENELREVRTPGFPRVRATTKPTR